MRELENVMGRAAILCERTVDAGDLSMLGPDERRPLSWQAIERAGIEEALRIHHGNRSRAAEQLGTSVRTLQYRLKDYQIEQAH